MVYHLCVRKYSIILSKRLFALFAVSITSTYESAIEKYFCGKESIQTRSKN